jgi:hypothetical protein
MREDDYPDEPTPAQVHCKQDGWVWPGVCPHCYPGCACGKRCSGPYLAGLDDDGRPSYSPFMTVLTGGDRDG